MDSTPLSFLEKGRLVLACVVAVLVMDTVGWHAAGPADPNMAVTLILREAGIVPAWVIVGLLAAVSAAVGTAIAGRRLPEAGLFAAGVGLTGLALRGGSMQILLGYYPADSETARHITSRLMDLREAGYPAQHPVTSGRTSAPPPGHVDPHPQCRCLAPPAHAPPAPSPANQQSRLNP